jgi:hypothetical protein
MIGLDGAPAKTLISNAVSPHGVAALLAVGSFVAGGGYMCVR